MKDWDGTRNCRTYRCRRDKAKTSNGKGKDMEDWEKARTFMIPFLALSGALPVFVVMALAVHAFPAIETNSFTPYWFIVPAWLPAPVMAITLMRRKIKLPFKEIFKHSVFLCILQAAFVAAIYFSVTDNAGTTYIIADFVTAGYMSACTGFLAFSITSIFLKK